TDPDPKTGLVVVVMLVTERDHTEKTVTLGDGDHPFIRHPTNVNFGSAVFLPSVKLDLALANGAAKLQPDFSKAVLSTIRAGLLVSSYAPHDVLNYCKGLFGNTQ
ncbi:MAG TPA: hypothetical protein VN650_12240, partial [Gemmatimonadaceae bacterium]|nr:hypothetical protein [Gemmatimonadaceae bacterium]